jgi:hypothetical protein
MNIIAKLLDKSSDWGLLLAMKGAEVGQVDGIVLFDLRKRGDSFRPTMERALRMIREHDSRRYARVSKYISRITNSIVIPGLDAVYFFSIRTVHVEFRELPLAGPELLSAFYACLLVHESTHGVLNSRGIKSSKTNRVRVERLCVSEQNRFAARLSAADPIRYPCEILQLPFDERHWHEAWNAGFLERSSKLLWRTITDKKLDQPELLQPDKNHDQHPSQHC